MTKRKIILMIFVAVVTAANAGLTVFSANRYNQATGQSAANQNASIVKSAKQVDVDQSKQGEKANTGFYKSEIMQASKIQEGDAGQLVLASNSSGANFVLAVSKSSDASTKLNSGWQFKTLASD